MNRARREVTSVTVPALLSVEIHLGIAPQARILRFPIRFYSETKISYQARDVSTMSREITPRKIGFLVSTHRGNLSRVIVGSTGFHHPKSETDSRDSCIDVANKLKELRCQIRRGFGSFQRARDPSALASPKRFRENAKSPLFR